MTDNDYTREDVLRHAGFTLDIDTSQMLRDYAALLARVEQVMTQVRELPNPWQCRTSPPSPPYFTCRWCEVTLTSRDQFAPHPDNGCLWGQSAWRHP